MAFQYSNFNQELEELINKYSRENLSDTQDWVLATYVCDCLEAYEQAIQNREGGTDG